MTITEIAAWVGALSGLGSLTWNIYLKLTAGPRLTVSAFAGMVLRPSPSGDPTFLKITVCNTGTALTTLTGVTFHTYNPKWARCKGSASCIYPKWAKWKSALPASVVFDSFFQGKKLPFKLEVGSEWTALIKQQGAFENKKTRWCAIHHSFSKKPAQVKVSNLST